MTGPEPVDRISKALDAAVERILAGDVAEVDTDTRAVVALHDLTHRAMAYRTPDDRDRLLAAMRAGDTTIRTCMSPRSRPALASIIAGEVIVVAELTELVPGDDLM